MSNEVYFNELCLNAQPNDYDILLNLKECYEYLRGLKCTVCRVAYADHTNLRMYIDTLSKGNRAVRNFMYSFFKSPYEEENPDEQTIEKYINHEVSFQGKQATGMTWATINNTLTLSLLTDEIWNSPILEAKCHDNEIIIHNTSKGIHVEQNRTWFDSQQPIELLKTSLKPSEKAINYRDDHGKKELTDFWTKLRMNCYVVAMINSLPFNSHERKFVHNCFDDGRIELVLHWLDEGYGMVIQTTGRNMQETKKIAEILTNDYDSRT